MDVGWGGVTLAAVTAMGNRTAAKRASLLSHAHSLLVHQLAVERRTNDALRHLLDGARHGRRPPPVPLGIRLEVIARRVAIRVLQLRRRLSGYVSHAIVAALSAALGVTVGIAALRASSSPPSAPVIVSVPVPQAPVEIIRYLEPAPPREVVRTVVASPPRGLGALVRELRFARCGASGRVTGRVWLDDWGRILDVTFQGGVSRGSRVGRCLQRHVDRLVRYDLASDMRPSDTWVTFATPYGVGP